MQQGKEDRSLGELFSELSRQTTTLIRQEVTLAKTEMTDKASKLGKDVASMAAGGAIAYAGFLVLLAAFVLILNEFLDLWLSALIVAVVVLGIGYMLIQRGRTAMKHDSLAPTQTIETLKDDAEWAKRQTQ